MTPVVVSSVPAMMSPSCSRRARVEDADHVGAVVHRDVRLVVDRSLDVRVVRVVVLALDREDADVVLVDERRGDVVLRRQRVRGAQHDVGAARLQRPHEVRGLGRDVEAGGDAVAVQRLLPLEALADRGEHRHLPVGPLDPPHALLREREVLYVVALRRCHRVLSSASGGEQPFVLALFPLDPGASSPGEPAVDRGPELGLAAEPRGERDVADPEAEARAQLGERAKLVQLAQAVEPVAGGAAPRDDEAGAPGSGASGRPARLGAAWPTWSDPSRATLTQLCQGLRAAERARERA